MTLCAVTVIVDVDDSTQAEFEEHAAINESVSVKIAGGSGAGCPGAGGP